MTETELNQQRQRIAEEFKAARINSGLTQQDLVEKTGMGVATISRFESGRYWLNMKQYIILRKAVGMPDIK